MKRPSLKWQNLHIPSHIILGIWSLIVLFPLWVMLINSFKDRLSIYQNPSGLPQNGTSRLLELVKLLGLLNTVWALIPIYVAKVLAVLTLSAIPVIALYLTASKQFIKGLTAGAVQG